MKRKKRSRVPALPPGPSPEEIKRQEEERAHDAEARRRREEVDAKIKREREEKEAKMRALDEKIGLAQTELTLLEKSLFEVQHAFERAQVDLAWHHDETSYVVAKETADLLHDTRMLIIARKVEHDRFVDERNALGMSKWQHWAILGLVGLAGLTIYYAMLKDKKK